MIAPTIPPTPPDIGPGTVLVLVLLAFGAKVYYYRKTRNPQALAEALVRFCVALFYALIVYAVANDEFGVFFTPDLWRIYARYAIAGLFVVEAVPWLVELAKSWLKSKRK